MKNKTTSSSQSISQLQDWILKRYLRALDYFKNKQFTFEEFFEFLNKEYGDDEDQAKVILSEINQTGLLVINKNPKDKREKIYNLKPIVQDKTNNISSKDQLINLLKQAADIIRTRVDYTFILLLLFYKAYSDKWQKEFEKKKNELLNLGWSEEEATKEAEFGPYHTFNFPKEYLWDNIRKEPYKISEKFSMSMRKLAELNPDYQDIFSQFDFHNFTSNPENSAILNQLVELFSKFSFKEISGDILGDAYEWILKHFAPQKAKEGEIFTPREVIRLMIEILDPKPKNSIYDPSLGSSGMLIMAYKYIEEKYNQESANTLLLYGQEVNSKAVALAKMNMLLHGIKNFNLALGDTLLFPKFKEKDFIKTFDFVLANPPWNQDAYGEEQLKKADYWQERFKYGCPTKQSADWAWVQHMLASSKNKVAVVLDTGAVSRSGREKLIRQKIVEADLIESVILLPEKLFYNTGAPAIIIVLNKNKPEERKNKILLINASKEFKSGKKQNILDSQNIKKIVEIYKEFKEVDKFSKIIILEEAKEADYNLSPSRFVMIIEEEKHRPINEILKDIEEIEKEIKEVEEKIRRIF
ncbi:MAG: type I restriction-modification system subunit M [Patescibacteria group bacterium]|nr:type I restriction-modification system subunit M [Patescibacteria group bacterium]